MGIGGAAVALIAAGLSLTILPSLMELLGSWNWWQPRVLRRLHSRFDLPKEA